MSFERYSRATQSANLGMSDWRILDVDWIAAAGACQVNGASLPALVARWLSGDHKQVFPILADLQRGIVKRTHRQLSNSDRDDILSAADWWHDHTCSDCGGRGHRQIPNTPAMEEADCPSCGGSGRREHPCGTYAYNWALKELDAAAAVCAYTVSAKVAGLYANTGV
jgi:hypothetical protein